MNDKDFLFKVEKLPKDLYFKNYADITSFISYHYQINSVIKTKPKTILEVGIGNKIVFNYLKQLGFEVTSCDINKNLEPDKVGDIRNLPFADDMFDVVLACEILEHIPFGDVSRALSELKRVSKKNVILSVPYSCFFIDAAFAINIPYFYRLMNFDLKIPFFIHKFKEKSGHFWEMGTKEYPKKKIKYLLNNYFKIKKEFQPILNPYHYFFVLEKEL